MNPLAGMTVVEVSSFVAAPLCGMTLSQLGAQVIRIDPIGAPRMYSGGRCRQPVRRFTGPASTRESVRPQSICARTKGKNWFSG